MDYKTISSNDDDDGGGGGIKKGGGQDEEPLSIRQLTLCGFLSGTIVSMILTPVELIKCKLQVQGLNLHTTPTITTAKNSVTTTTPSPVKTSPPPSPHPTPPPSPHHHQPAFRGALHILQHTLRTDGPRGLYRGHLGTFLRESGGGAAWFGTYEWVCRGFVERERLVRGVKVVKGKEDLAMWQQMVAGACAGMVS